MEDDKSIESYFKNCLYFTVNSLSRAVTRMAEEEFSRLGMSPSHAFLLMLAIEQPGITQKEIANHLNLAQSTVSRFADSLVLRGYIEKRVQGKQAQIYPTDRGEHQLGEIHACWHALYERYSKVLGQEAGDELAAMTSSAYKKLSQG